ncbi:MAG: hypothetical protein KJO40_12590 [Deltaproteobacteria bacterium]|nr:hypothetical protein [Deltaproteobacteria bacterium]NND28108.1 hypothetical protein [Myxococcales bacterium]MBT8465291.1 hypothetical protein [Deltaproteobacteria bacterium]MBT8481581.1 hypothetical protein [Deltaproteobacteria bacterium]NNK07170.1 hypothetical protein [Myxococcales bacterium]
MADTGQVTSSAASTVNWTYDKTYILDGYVVVGPQQTLNIQAGTINGNSETRGSTPLEAQRLA